MDDQLKFERLIKIIVPAFRAGFKCGVWWACPGPALSEEWMKEVGGVAENVLMAKLGSFMEKKEDV